MLEKFVANVLTTYLGKYIDNLDKKHVKVSIWNGNVVLENLKLKRNALRYLDLPISIKDSNIGRLKVFIPWTRLRSESVKIEIEDVVVVVHPKKAAKFDQQQEDDDKYEAKLEELDLFEATRKEKSSGGSSSNNRQAATAAPAAANDDEDDGEDRAASPRDLAQADEELARAETEAKDASFVQRLKGTMIKNVQIVVRNVDVQYEDAVTDPSNPISMSFKFDSFTAHSTNGSWQPHFTNNSEALLYKLVNLTNLSIAISTATTSTPTSLGDVSHAAMREVICNPLNIAFRVQHQPIPVHKNTPRWKADVEVADTHVTITRKQWDSIWRSVRYVQQFEHIDAFRRFRPVDCTPLTAPRRWWKYAIDSVLFVVRKHRSQGRFSWTAYVEMKKQQHQYMELHKRKQGGEWLLPLTENETRRHEELERALPLEVIKVARNLAYARHALEAEQNNARNEYIARRDARLKKKSGGWFGWWSGQAGPEEVEENPDDEAEVERLWGMIDADRWSDEQRRILAAEFGMDENDVLDGVHSPSTISASSKTVFVALTFKRGFFELTDYKKVPFVELHYGDCGVTYRGSETTYEFAVDLKWFRICEAMTAALRSKGAVEHEDESAGNIVAVARNRFASASQSAVRFQYQKLDPRDGGGIVFRVLGEVSPLDLSLNVPALQKVVSFWGVNASLVDDVTTTTASSASASAAAAEVRNAAARREAALPVVPQLGMWYERLEITQVQIQVIDLSVTIPDIVDKQKCRFGFQMISIVNDVEAVLGAKAKLAAGRTADITPEDWVEVYQVQLGGVSVTSYHAAAELNVINAFDAVLITRKSVVRANYDVPVLGIELQLEDTLRLQSNRNGYFVMFSAISLLTDFLNNMAGRGTSYVEDASSANGTAASSAASETALAAEQQLIVDVMGPFPAYVVHDVDERTDAMKQLLPPYPRARRFTEVTRGFVTLNHETRPSMPFAKLQLRPGQFTLARSGREVFLYVHQGGANHAVRAQLSESLALFEQHGVPQIPSIPQQGAALAIAIEQREASGKPFSDAVVSRLWAAFDVIKQSSQTNPCTCVAFFLESEAQALRFEKLLHQNAAFEELPVPQISGGNVVSDARKMQKLFDLNLTCPSLTLVIEDRSTTADTTVTINFCESVSLEFALTLFTRDISISSDGLVFSHSASPSPLWTVPKVGEDGGFSSVSITFTSSWLPRTTPELAFVFAPRSSMVLNTAMVEANELLWDLIGIFMMRHLTWSYHVASPWGVKSVFDESTKHKTMLLDMAFDGGVDLLMQYDDDSAGTAACSGRRAQPSDALLITAETLSLRWTMSEAANVTEVVATRPRLDMLFPNAPQKYRTFMAPKSDSPCVPVMTFSYKVLYKPFDMPAAEWMLQSGGSGFNHTHLLEMSIRHCLGAYSQPGLWSLLEYFTNGHMIRFGYIGWRPKYTLQTVPPRWGAFPLPPGVFNFALLHQNIEIVDVDACLPYSRDDAPWVWVSLPRLAIFSDLRHEIDPTAPRPSTNAEVRMGTRMVFSSVSAFAIKDDEAEDYRVHRCGEHFAFRSSEPVPLRPTRITEPVIEGLNMEFNTWFEAASLLKQHSEKTLEMAMDSLVFRGSTAQFCVVLEWVSRGLMEPWKGFYPPKVWPAKPFPRMTVPHDSPVCFYDWVIRAERACFHIVEGSRFFLPTRGNVYSGREPHTILDVSKLDVSLRWSDDASFASVTTLATGYGWDLTNAHLKTCSTVFVDDPRELVTSKRKVLRVEPDVSRGDRFGAIINYGWTRDGPNKEVYGEYNFSVFELDVVPRYLVNLRDTLMSLRVRNAIAPILKWPQYVVGVPPAPWDPKTQQWEVRQQFAAASLVVTFFVDPDVLKPTPIFQVALAGFFFRNVSAREAVRSEMTITLADIASNGIIHEDSTIRPVIVPQSTHRDATTHLLELRKASDTGVVGTFGCVWIFNPHQDKLRQLREALQHRSIAELQWAWEYREERAAKKEEFELNPPPERSPTRADDICFTILNPCLVVNEHNNTQRGIVINLGRLTLQRALVDDDSVDQELKAVVESANITSLHSQGEYLLTPTNAIIEGVMRETGVSEFRAHVDAILIDIAQEYYESLLHSAVRHLVLDEAALVERKAEETRARSQSQIDADAMVDFDHLSPDKQLQRRKAEAKRRAAESRRKVHAMSAVVDWDRLQLRVHGDRVAVVLATGLLHADYTMEGEFTHVNADLVGLRLGVEGRKPLLTLNATAPPGHVFAASAPSATMNASTTSSGGLGGATGASASSLSSMPAVASPMMASTASAHDPALVAMMMSSSTASPTTAATSNGEPTKIHFEFVQNGSLQEIGGDLGTCTIYLDHNAVVPAIAFLYEPYRRIVLPRYGVSEVMKIDDDFVLTSRLVLSSRKVLHISSAKTNLIQIDCNGHEVYFLDAVKPIVIIEPGVTVIFICGKIFLYDHPLEHYIVAGNGSYVVMEESRNAISRTTEADFAAMNASIAVSADDLAQTGRSAASSESGLGRDYNKNVALNVRLVVTLPEGSPAATSGGGGGAAGPATTGSASSVKRALTLKTHLAVRYNARLEFGDFTESGTFDIDRLQAECVYLTNIVDETVDFSSLISPWALRLALEGSAKAEAPRALSRTLNIGSKTGVDVRFRYGDFQIVTHALEHSKRSLSHIESEVLGGQQVSSEDPAVAKTSTGAAGGSLKIITNLPRVGFFIIDDSSRTVDFPLLYISILDIRTPTLELLSHATIVDISIFPKIEYYNLRIGGWDTLLQKLELRFAAKDVKNVTMQDVQQRKGQLKAGLYVDDFRLMLTPTAAHTISRISNLLAKLQGAVVLAEDDDSSATAAVPAFGGPQSSVAASQQQRGSGGGGSGSGNFLPVSSPRGGSGSGSNGTLALASPGGTVGAEEFFTYNVRQHVGLDIVIGFADNDEPRFPKPRKITIGEVFSFNFPRINGRELPVSQHFIMVNNQQLVNIAQVGLSGVSLMHGTNALPIVADVQLHGGRKVVTLRTHVSFANKLRFPICVAGVGDVCSQQTVTVPLESMRKRCTFCPKVPERCHDASLGVPFANLPSLFDQQFLCTCELDEPTKAQRAFYFLLSFGAQVPVAKSTLRDITATFEAPFNIINNTGVALQIGLLHRYLKRNHNKSKLMTVITGDSEYYFNQIVTLSVGVEESYPVTEVNPLENVYMDIILTQPTGTLLARLGAVPNSDKQPPALIRSRHKGARDRFIHLWDEHGRPLTLMIEYTDRNVVLSCPFWVVNQTQHYLQLTDANPKKKKGVLCSGLTEEGLPPVTTPLLVCTEKMLGNASKRRLFARVGQHSTSGEICWSQWSEPLDIESIRDIAICNCGDSERSPSAVSLTFSVQFVGGAIKDTRVIKFTPRWIVINRCPRVISVWQQVADTEQTMLASGHSHMLSKAMIEDANNLRVAYCEDDQITACEWSDAFSIDKFSERLLNLRYMSKKEPLKRQFSVVRVSCYTRASILYVSIDSCDSPPYLVENRTNFVVYCRQRDARATLTVYPRCTNGFVWEDAAASPMLLVWAAERDSQQMASRSIQISLDPATLTKRTRYQLAQDIVLPGGTVLFVRVRAFNTSYAISVTSDTHIDKFRLLPFQQFAVKLHVKSIGVFVGEDKPLWMAVSLSTLQASVSQGRRPTGEYDEFSADFTLGELQIDDYRPQSRQKVVLQSVIGKTSSVSLVRLRDRTNPMIHLSRFVVSIRPIQIHIEDSFLFEVIKLVDKFKIALGAGTTSKSLSVFENAPWVSELQLKPSAQDSLQWRMTFIEQFLIEQLVVSISLYRGADKKKDPIREQLGVLSMLIRSVQDARFEWKRIEHPNLYDQLWILATFIRNYYMLELEQQVLNVVHVAGLDTMRGFVTDLLEGYFSSTAVHIDRTAPLVQRSITAPPAVDTIPEIASPGSDDWTVVRAEGDGKVLVGDAARRNRGIRKQALTIEEFAERTTWAEFVEGVTPAELREHGHLALTHELRTRNMSQAAPPPRCRRCGDVERLRLDRWEAEQMSVLPHPSLGQLDWAELAHHVTWEEFIALCTPQEVRAYGEMVRDAILGAPYSVHRVDADMLSILEDRDVHNAAAGPSGGGGGGSMTSP